MTFLAAYTFAKALDDSSTFGELMNFSNYRLSRGLSIFDVTHNFVVSYNWALPFDRLFRPQLVYASTYFGSISVALWHLARASSYFLSFTRMPM